MRSYRHLAYAGFWRDPAHLAIVHAIGLIVFLSWRFGGMETFAREIAGWLCIPAPIVTWLAWRRADRRLRTDFAWIAMPLLGLAAIVGLSLLNPNMRTFVYWDAEVLAPREHWRFLPSTTLPAATLFDFRLNAGLVLVGLNLFLARPSRSARRLLLGAIAGNAAVLACAGTLFKLTGATLLLGVSPSPNPNFFATFIYHNHWGAFALLGAAAAAGLAFDYERQSSGAALLRTPAPLLGVFGLLLLLTLPLSTGRASTVAGLVFTAALALRLIGGRRDRSPARRRVLITAGAVALAALVLAATSLGRRGIEAEFGTTSAQIADLRAGGVGDARLRVYHDTWRLFLQKPLFGWGWQSFQHVYPRVQSVYPRLENEQKTPAVFLDAHNDWLQLLAELGLVGAGLSLAALVGVVRAGSFRAWRTSPCFELAAGAVGLALLACVDFPFACPAVVVTSWACIMIAAGTARGRTPTEPAPAA